VLRFKFFVNKPQREHNSVYKKWHINICANLEHSASATSHIRKTLAVIAPQRTIKRQVV